MKRSTSRPSRTRSRLVSSSTPSRSWTRIPSGENRHVPAIRPDESTVARKIPLVVTTDRCEPTHISRDAHPWRMGSKGPSNRPGGSSGRRAARLRRTAFSPRSNPVGQHAEAQPGVAEGDPSPFGQIRGPGRSMTLEIPPSQSAEAIGVFGGGRRMTEPGFHGHEGVVRSAHRPPHDETPVARRAQQVDQGLPVGQTPGEIEPILEVPPGQRTFRLQGFNDHVDGSPGLAVTHPELSQSMAQG